MSSSILLERGGIAAGAIAPGSQAIGQPGLTPGASYCVVPRCEIKVEKCTGGFKLHCSCEDDIACGTLQNLCKMLAGGLCSCCCTLNGIAICQCNLACGICKCEYTADGCCISCTRGDKACCEILQSCCETIAACLKQGCCCYICFGSTPVCCGCC
jgi:hypothetical protein